MECPAIEPRNPGERRKLFHQNEHCFCSVCDVENWFFGTADFLPTFTKKPKQRKIVTKYQGLLKLDANAYRSHLKSAICRTTLDEGVAFLQAPVSLSALYFYRNSRHFWYSSTCIYATRLAAILFVHTKQGQIFLNAITYEITPTENFVPVNGKVKGQLLNFHFNPALFADLALPWSSDLHI